MPCVVPEVYHHDASRKVVDSVRTVLETLLEQLRNDRLPALKFCLNHRGTRASGNYVFPIAPEAWFFV